MPALAPVAPRIFKRILELAKYETIAEDACCWILLSGTHAPVIPKNVDLVALEIMDSILHAAQINDGTYFKLLEQAKIDCNL